MRFDLFPMDEHICKFKIGSTDLDITKMYFAPAAHSYDHDSRNTILDYSVSITSLRESDRYVFHNTHKTMNMYLISHNSIELIVLKLYIYLFAKGTCVRRDWKLFNHWN